MRPAPASSGLARLPPSPWPAGASRAAARRILPDARWQRRHALTLGALALFVWVSARAPYVTDPDQGLPCRLLQGKTRPMKTTRLNAPASSAPRASLLACSRRAGRPRQENRWRPRCAVCPSATFCSIAVVSQEPAPGIGLSSVIHANQAAARSGAHQIRFTLSTESGPRMG